MILEMAKLDSVPWQVLLVISMVSLLTFISCNTQPSSTTSRWDRTTKKWDPDHPDLEEYFRQVDEEWPYLYNHTKEEILDRIEHNKMPIYFDTFVKSEMNAWGIIDDERNLNMEYIQKTFLKDVIGPYLANVKNNKATKPQLLDMYTAILRYRIYQKGKCDLL